jgi:hypothetical protein
MVHRKSVREREEREMQCNSGQFNFQLEFCGAKTTFNSCCQGGRGKWEYRRCRRVSRIHKKRK